MADKKSIWQTLRIAFGNRTAMVMLIFGFAAGLPNVLLLGTLNAWLGEAKVNLATIGVLSWIGLAYAFKFLWSPIVDRTRPPLLAPLGRRRSWLVLIQALLALTFFVMSATNPALEIGMFAVIAVIAAFASATQDIVIDAWRIDVADEETPIETLSTLYQLGYRIAALIGGALALMFAARADWPTVYATMAALMACTILATLAARDTERTAGGTPETELDFGNVPTRARHIALAIVVAGLLWAVYAIGDFMVTAIAGSTGGGKAPSASDFIKLQGPIIVFLTVILPAIIAAILCRMANSPDTDGPANNMAISSADRIWDHGYRALLLPLVELVGRLRWGVLVVIGLILTYRLCDSIWGPFAFPFYLDELHYTNDEVAFASKIFGVFATIVGISLAGVLFVAIGRLPTLAIGAVFAASSNLLYADLATGGAGIDAFARLFGLDGLAAGIGVDLRMLRLLIAIAGENVAAGLAGAAYVAYLSSIAAKQYSAVQYALLSSLTLLVGSLGRGAIGEAIEAHGYAPIFRVTAALGLIAVVFCLIEWARQSRQSRQSPPPPATDPARAG